jgi:uncharacterized protein YdgA (DUF945 family)
VTSSYERGWIRSRARTVLALGGAGMLAADGSGLALVVEDTIHHGPVPLAELTRGSIDLRPIRARVYTRVALDGGSDPELAELLRELPALEAVTTWELSERIHSRVELASFQRDLGSGGRLGWQPLQGEVHLNGRTGKMTTELSWPGLLFEHPNGHLAIEEVESTSDLRDVLSPVPIGESRFRIGRLSADATGQGRDFFVSLTGLEVAERDSERLGRVDRTLGLSLESARFLEDEIGRLEFELALRNLDKQALIAIQEQMTGFSPGAVSASQNSSARLFGQLLPRLLAKRPELGLRLDSETGDGPLHAEAELGLDEGFDPRRYPAGLALQAVVGEAELLAPAAFAERQLAAASGGAGVGWQLGDLVEAGVFVRRGDLLHTHLRYAGGRLRINGMPPELVQDLLTR